MFESRTRVDSVWTEADLICWLFIPRCEALCLNGSPKVSLCCARKLWSLFCVSWVHGSMSFFWLRNSGSFVHWGQDEVFIFCSKLGWVMLILDYSDHLGPFSSFCSKNRVDGGWQSQRILYLTQKGFWVFLSSMLHKNVCFDIVFVTHAHTHTHSGCFMAQK